MSTTRNRRDAIVLDPEAVQGVLESSLTLYVATIGSDGAPHLVPMYFVVVDGRPTFWTYGTSQKVANLRRDPRVCCLVEGGVSDLEQDSLHAVMIHGTARIDDDPTAVESVGVALHERYRGPVGPIERAYVRGRSHKRVVVQVEPRRMVSWDHAKLTESAKSRPGGEGE